MPMCGYREEPTDGQKTALTLAGIVGIAVILLVVGWVVAR
jgi:hypothetical protein